MAKNSKADTYFSIGKGSVAFILCPVKGRHLAVWLGITEAQNLKADTMPRLRNNNNCKPEGILKRLWHTSRFGPSKT